MIRKGSLTWTQKLSDQLNLAHVVYTNKLYYCSRTCCWMVGTARSQRYCWWNGSTWLTWSKGWSWWSRLGWNWRK